MALPERDGDDYGGGYRFHFPPWSPAVRALIVANVAVFVAQIVAGSIAGRPVLMDFLGVWPTRVFARGRLWQPLTYMFLHADIWHIAMNMLGLYLLGTQVEHRLGLRRFLIVYFGGGIAGGLAHCLTPVLGFGAQPAVGASGAVMAVLALCAIHFPDHKLLVYFVPVSLRWLAIFMVAINLFYAFTGAQGVAFMAHLGGMVYGVGYWRLSPAVAAWLDRREDRRREREAQRRAGDERRLDELLSKVGRQGLQSLTPRERAFLDEMSRRRRDRGYRG